MELVRAATARAGVGLKQIELVSDAGAQLEAGAPREAASRVALNPDYTFERFVIGPENQLAHAAALAVAEAPERPTTRCSSMGRPASARTHLLGSIANYLHRHSPELVVHYTTAECFTNEFVSSLQGTGIDAFKERYRRADAPDRRRPVSPGQAPDRR